MMNNTLTLYNRPALPSMRSGEEYYLPHYSGDGLAVT